MGQRGKRLADDGAATNRIFVGAHAVTRYLRSGDEVASFDWRKVGVHAAESRPHQRDACLGHCVAVYSERVALRNVPAPATTPTTRLS